MEIVFESEHSDSTPFETILLEVWRRIFFSAKVKSRIKYYILIPILRYTYKYTFKSIRDRETKYFCLPNKIIFYQLLFLSFC